MNRLKDAFTKRPAVDGSNPATAPVAGKDPASGADDPGGDSGGAPANDDPTAPTTLAQRIRTLIDALPVAPSTNPPSSPSTKPPKLPKQFPVKKDKNGKPIVPPEGLERCEDKQLAQWLGSATIMNGSSDGGGAAGESVWSLLEALGPPTHDGEETTPTGDDDTGPGDDDGGDNSPAYASDGTSIMFYSPFEPTEGDVVEIAQTTLVTPATASAATSGTLSYSYAKMLKKMLADSFEEYVPNPATLVPSSVYGLRLWTWPNFWPFNQIGGAHAATPATSEPATGSGDGSTTTPVPPPAAPPVRVWVPSTTKISFQAMWWGYRIYLPPPVLSILSDQTVEASKKVALITTALTWFFANIPIATFPPAIQPAMLLLQKLVPYIGYIGTFITWSWSTIKGYDVGYGVHLTATWLLPVALIPGTWHANDFPTAVPTPDSGSGSGTGATTPTPISDEIKVPSTTAPSGSGSGASAPHTGGPSSPPPGAGGKLGRSLSVGMAGSV